MIVPSANDEKPGIAGEEHARHRDHHREAGDEDRASRRRRRGLERCGLAAAGCPFLAFALEIEERVVDADGESDEQDHLFDLGVDRHQMARQGDQEHRRDHRRERQQQRDAGGEERAERDQQDDRG